MSNSGTTLYPGAQDAFVLIGTADLKNSATHSHRAIHNQAMSLGTAITAVLGTTAGTSVLKNFTAGQFAARTAGETLTTVSITSGTASGILLGTSQITGGTISNVLLGTLQITGGTIANATIGTPAISGGTVTTTIINNSTVGTPAITGGTATNISLGGTVGGTTTFNTFPVVAGTPSDNSQLANKQYVDENITSQDLDGTTDSGIFTVDLDSQLLKVTGGDGIDTSASGTAVTIAIDNTVTTLSGTQTLTNKTVSNATIGTPSISGGTVAGASITTTSLTSGTVSGVLIGTAQHTGGSATGMVMTANSMTSGTISGVLLGTAQITGGTASQPIIILNQGTVPVVTAEGDIRWDTDNDQIKIGDGAGSKVFSDDSVNASTYTKVAGGTLNNGIIGTSAITGGTVAGATMTTATMTSGTISGVLIGTAQHTGGTAAGMTMTTATMTSGTISGVLIGTSQVTGGTVNTATMGTPTITGGNWNAGTLGTPVINVGSDANYDVYYRSTAGAFTRLASGTAATGKFLKSGGTAAAPSWDTPTGAGDMGTATYDPAGIAQQLVGTSATQTLTNKTLTSPLFDGSVDGWTGASETWTYASASTFTVSGDVTAKYSKGTRLKWTQTTVKYGVVVASSYGAPNTTVTILINTDYTIANAAISLNYYSYQISPRSYPGWFALAAPTWTVSTVDNGAGGQPTTTETRAKVDGNTFSYHQRGNGTKAGTNYYIGFTDANLPAHANSTDRSTFGSCYIGCGGDFVGSIIKITTTTYYFVNANMTDNTTIDSFSCYFQYEI